MTKHSFMKLQHREFAVDNTNLGGGVWGFSELLFLV